MPRAGLNRDVVVREAALVADDVGLENLTLAAVAARLGVRLPSLYKHVDGLDGLRRDLAVRAVRELAEVMGAAAVGRSEGDALRAMAEAYRAYARAHPGSYAATVRAPAKDDVEHAAAADAVLRVVFAVLAGYGLSGDDAVDAARALRAAMHGFVTIESERGFGMPQDVDRSYRRLIDLFDASLAGSPPP